MSKQNEANGTASEPIARYDELPILRTYKAAFDNIVEIGGFWVVGPDKALYHTEMPDKVGECMRKYAKRYDIQTGKIIGYTNADRIRAMSDEELDKFLGEVQWDVANYCGGVTQKQEYPVPEQIGAWLDWLKQEAEA